MWNKVFNPPLDWAFDNVLKWSMSSNILPFILKSEVFDFHGRRSYLQYIWRILFLWFLAIFFNNFLRRYQLMAFAMYWNYRSPKIVIFNICLTYSMYNSHMKISWFYLEDKRNCFKWFILLPKRQRRPQDTDWTII